MNTLFPVIITAIDLLAIVTCIGSLACRIWVIPAKTVSARLPEEEVLLKGLRRLYGFTLSALTVNSFVLLALRTAGMSGLPLSEVIAVIPTVLFKTHYGVVWFVRVAALTALWAGWRSSKTRLHSRVIPISMFFAAAIFAWTYSASGHAADGGHWTLLEWMDWLHVMAASLWGGGILAFALVIRPVLSIHPEQQRELIAATTGRLSLLAGTALTGVMVSGLYSVCIQMTAFAELWKTPYGRTLSVKLLLVFSMVMLGASTRYLNLPFLQEWAGFKSSRHTFIDPLQIFRSLFPRWRPVEGSRLLYQFTRKVVVEAMIVVAVLICVALLLHKMPPHKQTQTLHTVRR